MNNKTLDIRSRLFHRYAYPADLMLRAFLISLAFAFVDSGLIAASAAESTRETGYVKGADISALPVIEARGGKFQNLSGPIGGVAALTEAGVNCFRLRLFVAPVHEGIVTNDLEYTLALARRVKASGAQFMLDLHYSDTWADPAKQFKPEAWARLPFEELVGAVREYTRLTLERFIAEGVRPDYVQIGNEITNGMLWPDGRVEFKEAGDAPAWDRLARLLRAGLEGLDAAVETTKTKRPKVILHIESTGDVARTSWWLGKARDAALAYDIVGMSYYPEWHGDIEALRRTLAAVAVDFEKPVMVVETAYPWKNDTHWRGKKNMTWPFTPEGQKAFLADVDEVVRTVPGGLGAGVCWWHPESIQVPGQGAWLGGSCALFDGSGRLLPAARVFSSSPVQ